MNVSEYYLLQTAFKLASGLSALQPTHTFKLPMVDNCARANMMECRLDAPKEKMIIF